MAICLLQWPWKFSSYLRCLCNFLLFCSCPASPPSPRSTLLAYDLQPLQLIRCQGLNESLSSKSVCVCVWTSQWLTHANVNKHAQINPKTNKQKTVLKSLNLFHLSLEFQRGFEEISEQILHYDAQTEGEDKSGSPFLLDSLTISPKKRLHFSTAYIITYFVQNSKSWFSECKVYQNIFFTPTTIN